MRDCFPKLKENKETIHSLHINGRMQPVPQYCRFLVASEQGLLCSIFSCYTSFLVKD